MQIIQPFEDFLHDNKTEPRKKVVVTCYSGNAGYSYSVEEGDFIIENGKIIATSDRLISRLK